MKKDMDFKKIIVFVSILIIFLILILSNSLSYTRFAMSDKLYGGKSPLNNIIIVKIDDTSINKIGRWPWDRSVFAELLNELKDAKTIGVDVSFFEVSGNDSSLEKTLLNLDNVILAAELNPDGLQKPVFDSDIGYVNLITEFDGITRGVKPNLHPEASHFAFKIYQESWNPDAKFEDKTYLVNYASKPGSFTSVSVYDVLNKQTSVDFQNKIVLIGATAPNLHDNYFVPTSEGIAMPGVEIHANIIQNLILDNFLERQSKLSIIFLTILAGIIGFFFLANIKFRYALISIIIIIVFYLYLAVILFSKYNFAMDMFFFPTSMIIFMGAGISVNYLKEKIHSAYLTDAFGKYVSKDLLTEIIGKRHQLKLGGTKRELTVFFSDIRGFTSISEKLPPEKLVSILNEYLTIMAKIINENKGTIDKFMGDAIMAFWNAPLLEKDHPKLACQSAIAQVKALKELQKSWKSKNLPEIKMGCGINTGEAVIGNMGSEDRFDYTAMGDTVNLASRLESLTKLYGVDILVSESTYNPTKNNFKFRKLDRVKVAGKAKSTTLYELLSDISKQNLKFSKQYEKALELYFKSKFKEAIEEFQQALKLKKDDTSSKLFIERCKKYLKTPSKQPWDGSFEIHEK